MEHKGSRHYNLALIVLLPQFIGLSPNPVNDWLLERHDQIPFFASIFSDRDFYKVWMTEIEYWLNSPGGVEFPSRNIYGVFGYGEFSHSDHFNLNIMASADLRNTKRLKQLS